MNDERLSDAIMDTLKTIYDPEIPVNVVDLGLIYCVKVQQGDVLVQMTLTNPGCPVAGQFPDVVKSHIDPLAGVKKVTVELVWEPPWTTDRMSEAARLALGM